MEYWYWVMELMDQDRCQFYILKLFIRHMTLGQIRRGEERRGEERRGESKMEKLEKTIEVIKRKGYY